MAILDTASAAIAIAKDPYLPKVTSLVLELKNMEEGRGARSTAGVGLREIYGPLRLWVGMKRRPILTATVAIAAVGTIFALGYRAGKRGK